MVTLDDVLLSAGVDHNLDWAQDIPVTIDPDNPSAEPYPHQYDGINLTFAYNRVGIYDETGSGKTICLQANAIVRAGSGHRVVCLMPPVLLWQFYESLHDTFVGIENHLKIDVMVGTKAQRQKKLDEYAKTKWPDIIIMTYALFLGKKEEHTFNGSTVKLSNGYSSLLKDNHYNVLIADEAQILRNSSSNIHKTVYKWIGAKDTDEAALVLSTGTVAHTHLHQVYGMIRLITPTAYGSSKEFDRLHVEYDCSSGFEQVKSYSNYGLLTANLYAQARRVTKAEVRDDMPEKINQVVPVVLEPAHKSLYKKLLKERLLFLDDRMLDATQDQALRQMAMKLIANPSDYSDKPIKNTMDEALLQLLDSIALDATKVLIFIHFNDTADRLVELLKEYNPALINGMTNDKEREKKKFLEDESCRIMVAHPKSAGAGLNLQKVSSDVIFYECPDSPGDITQAGDRVHRLNSKETVNIYFLSPGGTLAARKIRQVVKKDKEINLVVQDKKALLGDLFDE